VSIPFADIASTARANSETLLADLLPDGKRSGREWIATNPTRSDRTPGSFAVNLESGIWADFATGDGGGDLISLLAYLTGSTQGQAALEMAARLGMQADHTRPPRRLFDTRPQPAPEKPLRVPVMNEPAPPPAELIHWQRGKPSMSWDYQDAQGRTCGYACRFETATGKDVIPYSWTGTRWHWKAMPEPRPLYHMPDLLARPGAVVIVTEGEKAAEAALRLFPEACLTTWPGGSKALLKADWHALKGRAVILWPDADKPGLEAMQSLKAHLLALGAASVYLPELPAGLPQGFDAADLPENGREMAEAILQGVCPSTSLERLNFKNRIAP
jgi:putative DNA primase/helicase